MSEEMAEMINAAGLKKCSNKDCTQPLKPLAEFPKNKTSKDGHSHWCKDCHRRYRESKKNVQMAVAAAGDDAGGNI